MIWFRKEKSPVSEGSEPPAAVAGTPLPALAGAPSGVSLAAQHLPSASLADLASVPQEEGLTRLQRLLDSPEVGGLKRYVLRVLDSVKWLGVDYALDRVIDWAVGDRHLVLGFQKSKLKLRVVKLGDLNPKALFHGDIDRSAHLAPLEGRADLPSVICVGGLAGTAEPWLNFGQAIHSRYGVRVVFSCLAGHDEPSVAGLKRASLQHWQLGLAKSILEEARRGYKPILCTLSTSGIVASSLPEPLRKLLAEVIPVGAPIVVEGFHGKQLDRLMWWHRWCAPARPILKRLLIHPDQSDLLDPENGLSRLTFFRYIPFQAFQALRETQFAARQGGGGRFFHGLARHLFYGENDQYIRPETARRALEASGEPEVEVHRLDGEHIAMVGRGSRRFLRLGMRLVGVILRDPSRYQMAPPTPQGPAAPSAES